MSTGYSVVNECRDILRQFHISAKPFGRLLYRPIVYLQRTKNNTILIGYFNRLLVITLFMKKTKKKQTNNTNELIQIAMS